MPVEISFLTEGCLAELAGVGDLTKVSIDVIFHVAGLLELFGAVVALEHLIPALSGRVLVVENCVVALVECISILFLLASRFGFLDRLRIQGNGKRDRIRLLPGLAFGWRIKVRGARHMSCKYKVFGVLFLHIFEVFFLMFLDSTNGIMNILTRQCCLLGLAKKYILKLSLIVLIVLDAAARPCEGT